VFASGTMSWSYALDGFWHQLADARIQRTTANLLDAFLYGPPAAPADHLVATAPGSVGAGVPFTIDVTAADSSGAAAAGYRGTVHFSSTHAAAALPPDSTLNAGHGSFSATLATSGPQTITVSDAANSVSTTVPVTVDVRATTASPVAGVSFPFTVMAQDQFGNTDTAYAGTVRFTSTDTSAGVILPPNPTLASGQAMLQATLTKSGAQTITATDAATASIAGDLRVTVAPGAAATMSLDAPGSAKVGQSFNITVTLKDPFGNVATGYRGTVHFTTSDPLPTALV